MDQDGSGDTPPRRLGGLRVAESVLIGEAWEGARALAADVRRLPATQVPLRDAVGAVLAEDVRAERPVPHYDSSAMDGFAVAGPPPWRLGGTAWEVVTGGAVPQAAQAVLAIERATVVGPAVDGPAPGAGAHVRRAGEETAVGDLLVAAGTRLSPAHVAVLAIAGFDAVPARRAHVGIVLTGDEVMREGVPTAGRVRDAFDPLVPLAVGRLGGVALPPSRVGDDPGAIAAAISTHQTDVVVTAGGTGRSRSDRLRDALGDAEVVFDGVAMRPGHPALLARLPDGRPLLALPGNPLAAVAVLLSFLPPLLDGLTGAAPRPLRSVPATVDLPGWSGGTQLIPCSPHLRPAGATRPNMLRGLAASAVLAVVPPDGARAGDPVRVLDLPW